ncbi:anti-sigma factor [Serratia liquefaciens]|uniref:anti-sigma factor n=1 Tax=Serratia liquefaciens TaxID=614 RepID=UPI0022B9937C|nr:anti-sigma factor [Serratia liquefaciens]WBL73259.1 anti-sigma factor [Serratia liquefaciens]
MKDRGEYDSALAAEYALGTLRGPARFRLEQRIRREPALAEQVAQWQRLLAPLDDALAPIAPPGRVWKKIQLNLPPGARQPRWRWDSLVWALAACLFAVVLIPRIIEQPQGFTPTAVLNGSPNSSGQWIVSLDREARNLQLTPVNLKPVAAVNSLQLWAIPSGEKPLSLGLVTAQHLTRVSLGNLKWAADMTIAISLEPAGGSPTGQPTGPVLYSGQLASR